jgi:hypothetical protein
MGCRFFLQLVASAALPLMACGVGVVGSEVPPAGPPSMGPADAAADGAGVGVDGALPLPSVDGGGSPAGIRHVNTRVGAGVMTQNIGVAGLSGEGFFLAAIATKPDVAVSAVSGLGLDWRSLANQCAARSQTGLKLWFAQGRAIEGSQASVLLSAQPLSAAVTVSQFEGAKNVGRTGLANTFGAVGACEDGTDSTVVNVAIDAPPPREGAYLFAALALRQRTFSFGSTLEELGRSSTGDDGNAAGVVVLRSVGPVVSGNLSAETDWAAGVTELLP